MKTNDELRERFVMAIDEVLPPAPWLETRVIDAVRRRPRYRPLAFGVDALAGFTPGLRLAAGVVAILIAVATVSALLVSGRLHTFLVPVSPKTHLQTLSPTPSPTFTFTPSPAVRAANWPPGGQVPAKLAGCWQPVLLQAGDTLCLGGYSFNFSGDIDGNVVVNGSEIDFISDICTNDAKFGFDRYKYTTNGDTLVLTRIGTFNCHWGLQRSFTRVAGQ